MDILFNSIGTLGVALILFAYYMLQCGKMMLKNLKYHILNIIGSALILVSLIQFWNLPSAIIQTCWISISLYGIAKNIKSEKE